MLTFIIVFIAQGILLCEIALISRKYKDTDEKRSLLKIIFLVMAMIFAMILFEIEPFGLKRTLSTISGGHGGDWLQFWGTYLGIVFSVVLTLYVTIRQSEYDRENSRSNHVAEIYLSTLIQMNKILSEFSEAVNRLENGISFKNDENYFYKYSKMSRAIAYMQNNDTKSFNDELLNLVAIIPNDRKFIIVQSASNFNGTYLKIYNNELQNDWEGYKEVRNDIGRDNIDWFKEQLKDSHKEAVELCEEWLDQYKNMNKFVQSELSNVNYIYKK
ncbi:hypothetical protein J3330_03205 [Leuconostoc mesenteroides]|uniref:hypothetical protein n=1 Tax=Leuconostoc mesenteroides TaxID=1245 RepID=UPI001CBEC24D|nr:hypothetical protein [Leuconostoc mesenteroides]MBZ1518155.1 hypothetical protein [Leuconostoc mesenteroides]MBZ1521066.1 hypothetical protein [Leuconostoc mesenteroides]MBZ1522952.1 hypothetical protein [Leuconostoc mesenteroides]